MQVLTTTPSPPHTARERRRRQGRARRSAPWLAPRALLTAVAHSRPRPSGPRQPVRARGRGRRDARILRRALRARRRRIGTTFASRWIETGAEALEGVARGANRKRNRRAAAKKDEHQSVCRSPSGAARRGGLTTHRMALPVACPRFRSAGGAGGWCVSSASVLCCTGTFPRPSTFVPPRYPGRVRPSRASRGIARSGAWGRRR